MKKFKVFALILACALVFLFTACDNGETGEQQPQASVTISTPSASLDLYDTLQLSATAERVCRLHGHDHGFAGGPRAVGQRNGRSA